MFWIYLLRCADRTYYCGYTCNLKKRLRAHNSGKASRYTRTRLPVKIIYFEKIRTKSGAMKREFQIKQLSRKEKEVLAKGGGTS
ncbi:MAG: GIY-YIG nuclease family protein [Candidatus Diapherotrites archaeon]|nr:GIY-YIG nuclease family protein [Candidatus Diapherotrites archaeon]